MTDGISRIISAAGTGETYIVAQAKPESDGWGQTFLHVQILGPAGNRGYGFVADVTVPANVAEWFKNADKPLLSLAGTSERYAPIQLRFDSKRACVRLQAKGAYFNRPYGLALKLGGLYNLADWVSDQLAEDDEED